SFDSRRGSSLTDITQNYNTNISKPSNPIRSGYTFDAWYSDSSLTQLFTFNKMPAKNTQLYASWIWNSNGLTYVKVIDHIEITGYTEDNPELTIPDEILNLPVTIIQSNAFYDNKILTDVIIADTITAIGYGAFQWAENIVTVTFEADSQLSSIGNSAFESAHALKTIEIPKSVTSLGNGAFSWTTSLESITFEAGSQLTTIGTSAFDSAHALKTITIPSSVVSIGDYAFTWNTSLESFYFEADSQCTSIGDGAFASDAKLSSIIIPASVVSLGGYAFSWDVLLTSVTFETGSLLESIGSYAFSDAQALSTIIIPSSVTSIGSYAFSYNLTPFTLNVRSASKPVGWASDWIVGSGYTVVYGY
ncbi:MAG: leucine-rich repeat protein, partial [Erysipelotrichaceae bacterium]